MEKKTVSQDRDKKNLSRELVLESALKILDEEGVEGLSMRSLGKRLGVEAMSLYNHVKNKDEVLDGVLDRVLGQITVPDLDKPWRQAMEDRARSAWRAFKRHPWASALMDSRLSASPGRLRYYDRVLGNLVRAGFSLQTATRIFSVLDSYVYGFGQQYRNMEGGGEKNARQRAEAFQKNFSPQAYPFLAEAAGLARSEEYDEDVYFEFGLALILDGLERALQAPTAPEDKA